jgi:predicted unusual protein kinase regulating ubiquinone biosynthesis (AarF/ABC1/UbiB family)
MIGAMFLFPRRAMATASVFSARQAVTRLPYRLLTGARWILANNKRSVIQAVAVVFVLHLTIQWCKCKRRQAADATSEWGRYARNPGTRGRALFTLGIHVGTLWVLSKVCRGPYQTRLLQYAGNVLTTGLIRLGALYIKLGQIVSSREKLLPAEWIGALERLQDQVPAKSGAAALELAYAAWPGGKADWEATFQEFNTTPVAAASLGQVHTAVLATTGDVVAVKLQRPFLREIYDQDLALLTKVAAAVDKFAGSAGQVGGVSQSWTDIFEDAEAILYREIDYRDEAENGIRFCNDFGLTKGGQAKQTTAFSRDGKQLPSAAAWLRAPYVYGDMSSEKVLVMEYVPSIKISNQVKLAAANVTVGQRELLADSLARAYLRQFCCNLLFSTDPHAGNLGCEILENDPVGVRLVFYDFGQAATLNKDQADGILGIIEAIVDSDVDRSLESFAKMGVLTQDADLDRVRAKVADNFKTGKIKANRKRLSKRGYKFKQVPPANATSTTTNNISTSNTTQTTAGTTTKDSDSQVMQYFTLPAEYAFVGRALTQMDGVGKGLDEEFDFISSAAPWIVEIKGPEQYVRDEVRKWFQEFSVEKLLPRYVSAQELERRRSVRRQRQAKVAATKVTF